MRMKSSLMLNSINRHEKLSQLLFLGRYKHRCYMLCLSGTKRKVWEAVVEMDLPKLVDNRIKVSFLVNLLIAQPLGEKNAHSHRYLS